MLADGADTRRRCPETLQGVVAARIDALPNEREGAPPARRRPRQGVLDGRARRRWSDSSRGSWRSDCTRSSGRSSSGASIARPSRARAVRLRPRTRARRRLRPDVRARPARDVHRRAADWIESLPADRAEDRARDRSRTICSSAIEYSPRRRPRRRPTSLPEGGAGAPRGRRPCVEHRRARAALGFYDATRDRSIRRSTRTRTCCSASAWRSLPATCTDGARRSSSARPRRSSSVRSRGRRRGRRSREASSSGSAGDQEGAFVVLRPRAERSSRALRSRAQKQYVVAPGRALSHARRPLRRRRLSSSSRRSRWPRSSATTSSWATRSTRGASHESRSEILAGIETPNEASLGRCEINSLAC